MAQEPEICVFALGGTIAMAPQDARAGVAPKLGAAELLGPLAGSFGGLRLSAETLASEPSASLSLDQVARLAQRIRAAVAAGACGVVVTQGTDTLEEVAFLLDVMLELDAPVVVTGAMRPPGAAGADGPANLAAAIRTAASPAARGAGVLVVMNDEVHAARFVGKRHAHRPSAFASPLTGPMGWIAEDRVRIALRPARRTPTIAWEGGAAPEVVLLATGLGDEGRLIRMLAERPPAGVVIEALGGGHVGRGLVEPLSELSGKVPVVLASRTGAGEVLRSTYGFTGGEIDLAARGLIPAGALDGPKARLLLMLLLAVGAGRERIVETFAET